VIVGATDIVRDLAKLVWLSIKERIREARYPTPRYEIFAVQISPNVLQIVTHSNDAANWLAENGPHFGDLALCASRENYSLYGHHSADKFFTLSVWSKLFDTVEVIDYLETFGNRMQIDTPRRRGVQPLFKLLGKDIESDDNKNDDDQEGRK